MVDDPNNSRTWIKIHTGLTNDEKHRQKMGVRIWFFMWLIDHVDWETGIVYGYTDAWAAREMEVSQRTIEDQRQHLEKDGYIVGHQRFQSQDVRIMRWRNPRYVDAQQINIPDRPETWYENLRTHNTEGSVPMPTGSSVPLHKTQSESVKRIAPPGAPPPKKPKAKKELADDRWSKLLLKHCFPGTTYEDAKGSPVTTGTIHRILLTLNREKATYEEVETMFLAYEVERVESNYELPPLSSSETIAKRVVQARGTKTAGGSSNVAPAYPGINERIKRGQQ